MVIQGRALTDGAVLPRCPYGGCGGTCPYCERALSNRRLAALTAASAPRGALAGFGARSYTTPPRDCPVEAYDGKPNGWQNWCDCMFAPEDPNRAKCRKRPCANPFDSDPDCEFSVNKPGLVHAPWTDPGAGIRGIPKESGGLLYLFGSGFRPVEPYEVEPDYFYSLTVTDPLRAAYIAAHSSEGFEKAQKQNFKFAVNPITLQTMYLTLSANLSSGALLGQIPVIGGVFTAQAATVFFGTGGMNTWLQIAPWALPYTFIKDPSGERADRLIFQPAIGVLGEALPLISGTLGTVAGDPTAAAGVIRVLCRRAARMLPATGAVDVEIARGLLNAAADSAPLIADIIRDPQGTFTAPGAYSQIGRAVKSIGKVVAASSAENKALGDVLFYIGDTFEKLDPSLTKVAYAIATGDTAALCCDTDSAFDLIPINYIGIKISTLRGIAEKVVAAGKATSDEFVGLALGSKPAKSGLDALKTGFGAILQFATELNRALRQLGNAGKYFSDVIAKITEQKAEFDKFVETASRPDGAVALTNAATHRRTPFAKRFENRLAIGVIGASPLYTRTLPVLDLSAGSQDNNKKTPPKGTPTPGPSGAVVLLGAGTGFLVGGPVGAAVGAGAALVLGGSK